MNIPVDQKWTQNLLEQIVACDSVNPAFPGANDKPGRGEAAIVQLLAGLLEEAGLETHIHESAPGRPSVVGVLRGHGGGRSLMLNGHIDTVGPGDMKSPFTPRVEQGRLYGRGAYDMKGGVAACVGAARALVQARASLAGDLVVALVGDEEDASLGTRDIVKRYPVDGAIVTEPTELRLGLAHKGFTWVKVRTRGVAYHGSMWEKGVDANLRMGKILARLAVLEERLRQRDPHPLLGPPSLHAALLSGGVGPSVYSPECSLQIERRTLPGETAEQVVAEIQHLVEQLHGEIPATDITVEQGLERVPFEADADSLMSRLVGESHARRAGSPVEVAGVPYWADAAFLRAAGADTVLYGPGGEGAHADVEWVDLESVFTCAQVIAEVALDYSGPKKSS